MVSIKIFVEGGGDREDIKTRCRQAFSKFFDNAGLKGRMPKILPCGGLDMAYKSFCIELQKGDPNIFPMLLIDSEAPLQEQITLWEHLARRDKWQKPLTATDNHVYLMVQCMEAWFFVDKNLLERFFGKGFNKKVLAERFDVENIAKADLFSYLKNATRHCEVKGEYSKGAHSFKILELLDPNRVIAASPQAKRLIDALLQNAS